MKYKLENGEYIYVYQSGDKMKDDNIFTKSLAKLLKNVEKHMFNVYEIEVNLILKIDSGGNLEILDGSVKEGECFMVLDLDKDLLYEDDIVNQIKASYDYEIRQELIEKISEDILPNKTIEELEGIVNFRP